MSYRFDMQGKGSQAQAIVRKRDEEDRRRTEEYKAKQEAEKAEKIEQAEEQILNYLSLQTEPKSLNDIGLAVEARELYVIPALSNLVRKRSINTLDMINKVSGVSSDHYFIQKEKNEVKK